MAAMSVLRDTDAGRYYQGRDTCVVPVRCEWVRPSEPSKPLVEWETGLYRDPGYKPGSRTPHNYQDSTRLIVGTIASDPQGSSLVYQLILHILVAVGQKSTCVITANEVIKQAVAALEVTFRRLTSGIPCPCAISAANAMA